MPEKPSAISDPSSKSGMSLLEVILAIAVAGFVLAAAVSLLVSISNIWSERSERHFFVDHVDGVTEFLNATFATAGIEIASSNRNNSSRNEDASDPNSNSDQAPATDEENNNDSENAASTNSGLIREANEPIGWARPPGFADYKEPLLNFIMADAPPILVGIGNAPLLGIDAFLYFEANEGLSLLWYSILQEEVENISDLRRTVISKLVTQIHYIYWDERFEKWQEEDQPKQDDDNDQYLLPRFIKLTFEYEGETQERTLTIPVPSKSAFIF